MQSSQSEDNKSNSGTTESEKINFREQLKKFQYPNMPKRDNKYRQDLPKNKIVKLITNLFEVNLKDQFHKFTLFSVEISPTVAEDNSTLLRKIYTAIVLPKLPKSFKKVIWAGRNLFTFISEEKFTIYDVIEINEELDETKYKIKLLKVKDIVFKEVNDFNGTNQQIKSVFENTFRNIVMRNPNVITFHDRTIFEIDRDKIINVDGSNKDNIYKGYISSFHITENGLYMLINNRSKLISGKTALEKINEIKGKITSGKESKEKIREYFEKHKTVLTTYGAFKSYKIKDVGFDKNPSNTYINIKDINGEKKSTLIKSYYSKQYNIIIKDLNQPLLIAENNSTKNKKLLPDKNNNLQKEEVYVIYLIPELVFITGIDEDDTQNNIRNKNRNIISKTKMSPAQKMEIINGGKDKLLNSDNHKTIKKKNGEKIELKSPKELVEEWGINIGENLTFHGRIISQPELYFKSDQINYPKNGIFQSGNPFRCETINNDNIFFVYDKNEQRSNHRKLFESLMFKCRRKEFNFSNDFNPNKVAGYGLDNTRDWENIDQSLRRINLVNSEKCFGIVFCSRQLEKFYEKLKNYFHQQCKIPTQFVITYKIEDNRRGNSIQFNLVDQMNIKMGGMNFYINFKNEGIIKSGQVFLIIGLDSKLSNKNMTYSMTSTRNSRLNDIVTQEETCPDNTEARQKTLQNMFKVAIDRVNRHCPHSPDFIIIYRQGGNEVRNKILTINELPNFTGVLEEYREKYKDNKNFNFRNTKLYYICCNLKSDLKFFETEDKAENKKAYFNPKSGTIVDDHVTQKSKYEFYIQPQFVNQGTATPCHYQVMYYDKAEKEEDELKIENLEKLSFYMSYYYWTWSGAIRVPALLKLSNTAMGFCSRIFKDEKSNFFDTPTFI